MSVKVKISNLPNNGNFVASSPEMEKIRSSFSSSDNSVGNLRWVGVSNGRYEHHHPVWDESEAIVGYLVGGVRDLGYTYCCLYSDRTNRFFVSHVPFGMVWGGGTGEKSSFISTVETVGKFWLFKQGLKYQKTSSFKFPSDWVGSERIYRFINDGQSLLCVSGLGFCVINVYQSSLIVKTLFGNDYTHMVTGAELSPNTNILAITMCEWRYTDPVKGENIYQNTVQIYDVKSGEQIGVQDMGVASNMNECSISFNEDGDIVAISSNDFNKLFKLEATIG